MPSLVAQLTVNRVEPDMTAIYSRIDSMEILLYMSVDILTDRECIPSASHLRKTQVSGWVSFCTSPTVPRRCIRSVWKPEKELVARTAPVISSSLPHCKSTSLGCSYGTARKRRYGTSIAVGQIASIEWPGYEALLQAPHVLRYCTVDLRLAANVAMRRQPVALLSLSSSQRLL